MPLRFTDDVDDYFRDPGGACLQRTRFFCSSPGDDLYSLFAWGHLDASDTEELFTVFASAERHDIQRIQLVVLRHVASVTMDSMATYLRYFRNDTRYMRTVAREAVVRPGGVVGVLSEGFYPAVPRPYPGKVFVSLGRALEWLGFEEENVCDWLEEVLALERDAVAPAGELLTELRLALLAEGASVSVRSVARRLGTSVRTLQRHTRQAGTTFEAMRTKVFLEEAKRRLVTSDDDVKRIAIELGYASPARLTDAFQREFGVPPTRWRDAALRRTSG